MQDKSQKCIKHIFNTNFNTVYEDNNNIVGLTNDYRTNKVKKKSGQYL